MTPADCHPGQRVRFTRTAGRVWIVDSIEGDWAQLRHGDRDSESRCGTRISSLEPADPIEELPLPVLADKHPAPSVLCVAAIVSALAFLALHVWVAVALGRSTTGLDPIGAAVAISLSGVGWSLWFGALLWRAWRGRRS